MKIVGLMSGTSADAIDAALFEITGAPPNLQFTMLSGVTYPYPPGFQQTIHAACRQDTGTVNKLCLLNREMGKQFGAAALAAIEAASLAPTDVDLIASAGQTVWHDVADNGDVNATFQIADAVEIAHATGITTISDFRTSDVAAGGHGAPMTGYADWLLLRHPERWRAVQNIGGIGNVTLLPPLSDTASSPMAFDTGPGNSLIDGAALLLTGGKLTYDRDGEMAGAGRVDMGWLEELMLHPYYERKPPKTTGRELFGPEMVEELVTGGHQRDLQDADIMATLTALTAHSIVDAYQRFAPAPIDEVILAGGGAQNPTLVHMIKSLLGDVTVRNQSDLGIDADYKEALVFALLGYESWHQRPGNHPALTGAKQAVPLGKITPGHNYVDLVRATWC